MKFNVILLAALADRIASHISRDAATWPVQPAVRRAIPVRWLAGDSADETRQLVESLHARTQAPYRALDQADAVAIVTERETEPAEAVITVWGSGGSQGLRCEISFPGQATQSKGLLI